MEKLNPFVYTLFTELNEHNIQYCVFRNYDFLPRSCGKSDLDIWVPDFDVVKIKKIINNVSKSVGYPIASYTPDEKCPKLCYLGIENGIQIDVICGDITYLSSIIFTEKTILESTVVINDVRVLEKRLSDVISLIKEILINGMCTEKYITPFNEHNEDYSIDYLKEKLIKFDEDFIITLHKYIATRQLQYNVDKLVCLGRKSFKQTYATSLICKIGKLTRVFKQPGYTIAFLGTDGSGKSFIINAVTPILNEAFHKGVRYEHMRPNLLPSLAVAMGKKKADEPSGVCSNPHGSKPSGFAGSLVRLSYYWLDYTWGYFRKIFMDKAFKTHVWIFDRYYYDYYIDQRRARLNLPNWILRLYGCFVPSPDLTICLGGDPEKIYARKPETTLEEVKRQTKVLKEFASKHKNAVWIDTTITPEESIQNTMDAIVKMMSKRFADTKL